MTSLSQISISYRLDFATPFHCGTGLRGGLIDRMVVRDHQGYLYVPGSTLKGVLRENCARLERLYSTDKAHRDLVLNPHDTHTALWQMQGPVAMVTRIFGTSNRPARLFFDDARLSEAALPFYGEQSQKRLQTDVYTQTRMHRLTGTASRQALYTSEFGSKHLSLEGRITGTLNCTPLADLTENPSYSLLLLVAGLHLFDRLGANKSAGKGQCSCEITALTLSNQNIEASKWRKWLEHLDRLADYDWVTGRGEEEL